MMEEDRHNDGLIVDDDEALDYVLYRELEKEERKKQGGSGCLGSLAIVFLVPHICISSFAWFLSLPTIGVGRGAGRRFLNGGS